MPSPTSSELTVDEAADPAVAAGADPEPAARWWSSPEAAWSALVRTDPWVLVRLVALGAFAVAAFYQYRYGMPWSSRGFPLEREQLMGWLLVGSVVWSLGRSRTEILYAVVGWGALGACFVLYDFTRGAIDGWWGDPTPIPGTATMVPGQSVHNADRIITAERALFFGTLPTEWLQDRFYQPGRSGPRWEAITSLTYLTHFALVYVVALVQWIRNRAQWVQWVRALVTLIVAGVIGYLLFPTAPPWLAGRFGLMDEVARPGTRGLRHVNLDIATRVWDKGKGTFNIVAAMPSLHFAFPVLVAVFFWRTARWWLRVILVAYPTVMGFTLAYGGEHYVLDCVVGGLMAWGAVWANRRVDTWWATRTHVADAVAGEPGPPSPVTFAEDFADRDTQLSH